MKTHEMTPEHQEYNHVKFYEIRRSITSGFLVAGVITEISLIFPPEIIAATLGAAVIQGILAARDVKRADVLFKRAQEAEIKTLQRL